MRTKQSRTNQEARAAGKARRVRSGALGKLLIMLAIVAAVVFGVAIFFKVSTIEVQGNTVYSSEQIVEASQIQPGDNLLLVDDFLANGKALEGLIDIAAQAGAKIAGASCAIEKGFQGGGDRLRAEGVRVESLAVIETMDDASVTFRR